MKDSLLANQRGVTYFLLVKKTILTGWLVCYNQSNHVAIKLLGYLVITSKIKLSQTLCSQRVSLRHSVSSQQAKRRSNQLAA